MNTKAGCKVHVGNGRVSRGHTIRGCIRCRGKIRFSLEWEPLTQTGEEKEIIRCSHSGEHQGSLQNVSQGLRTKAKIPVTEIKKIILKI